MFCGLLEFLARLVSFLTVQTEAIPSGENLAVQKEGHEFGGRERRSGLEVRIEFPEYPNCGHFPDYITIFLIKADSSSNIHLIRPGCLDCVRYRRPATLV